MLQQRNRPAGSDTTDRLIAALAAEMRPVRPMASAELRHALLGGSVVAIALFFAIVGVRADIGSALFSSSFWFKLFYTTLVASLAWWAVRDRGRPGAIWRAPWRPALLSLGPAILAAAGLAANAAPTVPQDWSNTSWPRCAILVSALALPIAAGLLWTLRGFAPVRIRSAGFLVGLVSGAIGAAIYSLGCGETSPGFVLICYSLAILLPAVADALVAPAILRW